MKERKKVSLFYGFMILVYTFAEGMFGFGFTAFMYKNGMDLLQIGLFLGLADFLTMIFDYPTGNIADRYGRKKIAGLGFVVYGLGFLVFGLSNYFWIFAISALIRALGISLVSGAPVSWYLSELTRLGEVEYKNNILPTLRGVALLVGSSSGLLASGLTTLSLSTPILFGGVILIISGLIVIFTLNDNYGNQEHESIFLQLKVNTKEFIKDNSMHSLVIFEISKTVLFTIFILSWQIYATTEVGLDYSFLGYLYTAMLLIMSASSFITKYMMKILSGISVTAIGVFLTIVAVAVLIFTSGKIGFVTSFIIIEFGFGLLNASYYTWLYDYINEDARSSYLSALDSIQSFAAFILSLVIGFVIQYSDFRIVWAIGAIVQFLAIYSLRKLSQKREHIFI